MLQTYSQSKMISFIQGIRFFLFTVMVIISTASNSADSTTNHTTDTDFPNGGLFEQNDYVFDLSFFNQANINKLALERLSNGIQASAGTYKVDVYINQSLLNSLEIEFIENNIGALEPCLTIKQYELASIRLEKAYKQDTNHNQCHALSTSVNGSSYDFDFSQLRLNLSIPHNSLIQNPRGYIPKSILDYGETIGFMNYYGNVYRYELTHEKRSHQQSLYIALNGGINFGKWQFRQQSNFTNDARNNSNWNIIRSYVKRPLTSINSELMAGQLTTSGRFFSGLSFTGINLSSDERMLPDSQRGYAPVIQGTANTTAKVSVLQNGREIYQTTVAPGPFRLNDLYPTSYNGDLDVIVTESDGTSWQYRVPFSAVPESIRQGSFKYNWDFGQTRDIGEDTTFTNINTQYGLSNALTINTGLRLANQYQALMAGSAFTSLLGAFGAEATYSHSQVEEQKTNTGWMLGANYSKTFNNTNTTIALAGYRFSTEGYRDLVDIIAQRKASKDGVEFNSSTYLEHSRAVLTLNQSLNQLGSLYISGSHSRYRDTKPNDQQLQLGYGKTFNNGVSLSSNFSRHKAGFESSNIQQNTMFGQKYQNSVSLSLNIPLDKTPYKRNLNLTSSRNNQHLSHQAILSGNIDRWDHIDYYLGVNYDHPSELFAFNSGLNKRFSYANTSVSYSKGHNYWQSSASIQGALALHNGGATFGPYLGDTFALIHAPGATGASPSNTQGVKINSDGYALIPALTPYRYNKISIDPDGMANNIELIANTLEVAPYAGATLKLNFQTRQGYALLIQSHLINGDNIPIGSDVLNSEDDVIGMSGQNSQIYLRTEEQSGRLLVKWGLGRHEQCYLRYNIPDNEIHSSLIRTRATCMTEVN